MKSVNPKVKIDADVTVADKKLKRLGQQKSNPTITPTIDNTQVVSGLKQAQKETKTLWERFTNGIFGINLIRMGVQEVIQAVRQAITNIKELNAIKTNIQMVSGTSDSGVNAMMSSYNDMAKDLSSTTKEVGEAANEFIRMGESVASTNELIKSSQVLSKVGMIESAESASYLISSLKGYKIAAENSMDVVSKLVSVDLKAAVSAGGLAEALSKCSNIADNSGVSMDRLIGYTATVGEVTQKSMSEVGNSFQSIFSRMNNIKLGIWSDENGESLSDTEKVLNKLGIQLRDTEDSYRSFDDVLDDIGKRWKDFTKVEQNAISVAIAGTRQRENFEALMNNYGDALKYSETAANSAGSALERYGIYQDSIQAKTNELTAAMESLSTNAISEELFSGIIEATTGVVEFVDKTNILKGTLAGIVTMGISKAFVSMATGIIAASKSTAQLTAAMALFDEGRSIANLKSIGAACKGLSDQQIKLVLSTKGLNTQQRLAILEGMGLEKQERQQTLATLGFAEAENIATVSTFSFKGALNSLMTAISMNPIGTIATAVSAVTIAFSVYKQHQEEIRQATEESANSYKESASSIEDYTSRYQELHKALLEAKGNEEETYNIKKQLLALQTELNDKFGEEHGAINLVTDAYRYQTEAIKALNKETAQTFLNENKEGIDKSVKEMAKDRHYNLSYTNVSSNTDEGAALKEIAEKYKEQGLYLLDELGDGSYLQFSIHLDADAQSAYDTINAFETDLRNKAIELGDEHIFDNVLDVSSGSLNKAKETIEKYGDIYKQALTAEITVDDSKSSVYNDALQAVEAYNEAVLNSKNPYDDQNVLQAKENLDSIKDSIQGNEEELGKYATLFDDVFTQADTGILDFNEKLKNDSGLKTLANDLNGFSDIDLKALDENIGANESFDKLKASAEEYNVSVNELIDTLIRLGYVQGEVQNSVSEIEIDSEPISFDQAWEDSFTSENEEVKKLGDNLLDLAEKGRLTKETFKEADSTGYFKNLGISADEAVSKINKMVDESKQLSSMSSQISSMAEALGTKKENGFVDADTLAGFDVEVRGLESWDKFQSVLGSTTSSYEECKDAANALATEWVNSSDFLAQLTEQNKEYYETQLEDMGVENYEEVIESTLALKEAKEALMDVDLSDAADEDIENLIQEGEYTGLVTEQIWALYAAKLAEQAAAIDSSSDCQQFLNLANNANLTAESIRLLTELMNIYSGLESGVYDKNAVARTGALAAASSIKAQIEKLASGEEITVKPELKVDGSKGKKSGGGSGSSKDLHKEAYEKELAELEHMHEMGLLSDADYWQERINLCERYFGESSGMHEKYLDEYQDNEKDILEGLKKLWEDYYDERKNNLKDLISYAEKLYDKEIDSHEASIEKIEEKRDAEKKYWEGRINAIGDEIDALEDANDQRERAVTIQQRQLALQKAMHQRIILLYSESNGMHYVNDSEAVRSSKNDLDDAEHDNKVADLKKQQDDLQKQLDIILETYDSQIESIEKQIESLKQVKSAWSDIVDNQELKELEERLRSIFGSDVKDKILSGNTDFISSIISQYSDTSDMLRTIEDATLADIQNMVAQYGVLPENLMSVSGMITDMANTLGAVDTSGFNANLDNTAQSSSNAAAQIQGTANAINTLSNEVSNYQMPELNAENITASLAEDGAILTALKGFTERFRELCEEIPDIWNLSLSEAFGAGGGNGDPLAGGLPNDTKYSDLFAPVMKALDECKLNMEAKLGECLDTFKTFQTDLSGVIGAGGSESSAASGKKTNASGGKKESNVEGGANTIAGAIQSGGALIDKSLNGDNGWAESFGTAQETIHGYANGIVECIESMAEQVVDACTTAINAINMLANADEKSGSNPTPTPYVRIGHTHGQTGSAHAEGTAKVTGDWAVQSDESRALVGEVGRELIVRDGKYFTVGDNGAEMFNIKKGDIVFNHEQTESLLKNGHISGHGKAYADGTVGGGKFLTPDGQILRPIQPGDRAWELQKAFEPMVNKILNGEMDIANNALFEHQRQVEQWTKNLTYSNVMNSVTNNKNMQPNIHVDKIEIMCPGVTSQQVVNEVSTALDKQLGHLSQRAMQEAYKR